MTNPTTPTIEYDVYSPFDIEQHKQHFVHYLEVVILEDGTVEYAVPSHQEKLLAIACKVRGKSREELIASCPIEYYGDFTRWLCAASKAIALWENYIVYDQITPAQQVMLDKLKAERLYVPLPLNPINTLFSTTASTMSNVIDGGPHHGQYK